MKNDGKLALTPKLRFSEFRNAEGWKEQKVDELVSTITPPKKLPTAEYLAEGAFPIIDQSQSYICGWTNDDDALIKDDLPLVVFGDHTCVLKLVDRPFAQGADGIKIIKALPDVTIEYLYQFLQFHPLVTEDYKRHFSALKEKKVFYPQIKSGEQQQIAECLTSVDGLIAAQARKVDALTTYKKGLMQQLFPRKGETQPRLRFPEFQNAGEWEENKLGDVASFFKGKGISKADITASGRHPCIRYGELYTRYGEVINEIISRTDVADADLFFSKSNDVIIPASGETKLDIAKASCVIHDDVALGSDLNVIRTGHNGVFLSYYLNGPKRLDIAKVAQGDTVVHLYPSQLEKLGVFLPENKHEQQRIADCLTSLDDLIAAHTQKLDALKTHKKGLMQQLFPSPEKVEA